MPEPLRVNPLRAAEIVRQAARRHPACGLWVLGMSNVVDFEEARKRQERDELLAVALQLIEDLGFDAGYQIALFARLPTLAPEARDRLLETVAEIERVQGFGWHFGESG